MFSAGATVCWFAKENQQGKGLVIRQGRGLVKLLTFRRVMHFFFFFFGCQVSGRIPFTQKWYNRWTNECVHERQMPLDMISATQRTDSFNLNHFWECWTNSREGAFLNSRAWLPTEQKNLTQASNGSQMYLWKTVLCLLSDILKYQSFYTLFSLQNVLSSSSYPVRLSHFPFNIIFG